MAKKNTVKAVEPIAVAVENSYTFHMDDGRKIVIKAMTQREALKLLKQQEKCLTE